MLAKLRRSPPPACSVSTSTTARHRAVVPFSSSARSARLTGQTTETDAPWLPALHVRLCDLLGAVPTPESSVTWNISPEDVYRHDHSEPGTDIAASFTPVTRVRVSVSDGNRRTAT